MKQRKSVKVRDGLVVGMVALSLGLSLACFSDDGEDNNNNNGQNNNTNNGQNNTNNNPGGITTDGSITKDETWSGTVTLKGDVRVQNAKLTLEPGTTIVMCADCTLEIGWNSTDATAMFNGTADKPITIRGEQPSKGFWGSVIIGQDVTSNSSFNHVIIDGGGSVGSQATASLVVEASIGLNEVQIKNGGAAGVALSKSKPGSKLSVTDVSGHGAIITDSALLIGAPDMTFTTPLGKPSVALTDKSWAEDGELVFKDYGIPFYLQGDTTQGAGTVKIEAGVDFLMAPDSSIEFGANGAGGAVQLAGTAEAPITFKGEVEEKGSWQGIFFHGSVATSSKLEHVTVSHAGGTNEYGAVNIEAALLVDHLTIEDSKLYGLNVGAAGLKDGSANVTVRGTDGHPARYLMDMLTSFPIGGVFEDNSLNKILVPEVNGCNSSAKGTLRDPGIPFFFKNCSPRLRDNAEWIISSGVELHFSPENYFHIGWAGTTGKLTIDADAANPVIFDSETGTADGWYGVELAGSADGTSSLKGVVIRNALSEPSFFATHGGALLLTKLISVEDVTIEGTSGNGIMVDNGNADTDAKRAQIEAIAAENTFSGIGQKEVCAADHPDPARACD